MKERWELWIDTGGTFTDCISVDPQGEWHRVKVLSTGRLRARLTAEIRPGQYRLEQQWRTPHLHIFKQYRVSLSGGEEVLARVAGLGPEGDSITLDKRPDLRFPCDIDLYAGEEAPVLAARLVCGTGLADAFPLLGMRLGSTKGTNALLERRGARIALLITEGFEDLPLIGTQQRPYLFQLAIPAPENLAACTLPVPARMDAGGRIIKALANKDIAPPT